MSGASRWLQCEAELRHGLSAYAMLFFAQLESAAESGSQAAANVQVFRDASRSQSSTYEFRMSKQPHSVVDTHSSLAPYELLPGRSGREVWRTNSVLVVSGP